MGCTLAPSQDPLEEAAGVDVTLNGDAEQWRLVTWQKNGYTYALDIQENPLSAEEIQAIISEVD